MNFLDELRTKYIDTALAIEKETERKSKMTASDSSSEEFFGKLRQENFLQLSGDNIFVDMTNVEESIHDEFSKLNLASSIKIASSSNKVATRMFTQLSNITGLIVKNSGTSGNSYVANSVKQDAYNSIHHADPNSNDKLEPITNDDQYKLPYNIKKWPIEWLEYYEERAAIMEFDGNLSKGDAEYLAEKHTLDTFSLIMEE